MKIALCPGQGSQSVAMFTPWLQEVPGFQSKLEELSIASGRDLIALGTNGDEETIRDTANAQPLIVAASIATFRTALQDDFDAVAGHSVGEFAAAAISGVLSDTEAMQLVSIRADAMAEAANASHSSMAAVIGGDPELVHEKIAELGLVIANYNGAGQVVAAGSKDQIMALMALEIEKARVIELKVAGAFHTSYMESAVAKLRLAAEAIIPKDPTKILWSNFDGTKVTSGVEFLNSLIEQIARPVRWDLCMLNFDDAQTYELPPAGALTGLVKRGVPSASTLALKAPLDLQKIGS
jgi:[acyl-carrier-protein] S-malonyltransferase